MYTTLWDCSKTLKSFKYFLRKYVQYVIKDDVVHFEENYWKIIRDFLIKKVRSESDPAKKLRGPKHCFLLRPFCCVHFYSLQCAAWGCVGGGAMPLEFEQALWTLNSLRLHIWERNHLYLSWMGFSIWWHVLSVMDPLHSILCVCLYV